MKSYKISILIITFLILILYSGCTKKQTNYDEMVKVTYELEGGTYQNCTLPVVQYYDFGDTVLKQIKDPSSLTKNTIEKQEYYLVGWFLDKNIDGDKITYTNQWDFTNDTVKDDNITLYAYWHKNIKYTYQVCYYDETNELQTLGEYEVEQGEKFDDYEDVAFRPNYTVINFYDKAGNLWNPDFNHPGGDEDNNVLVIAKYIEGTYSVINSIRDLMKAKEKNIYLNCDLDLEGSNFNFGDYHMTFIGNNHTISNFNLNYDASKNGLKSDLIDDSKQSLYVSLFGFTKGAVIKDVTFTNVTIKINTILSTTYKIYIAPISVKMEETCLSNVTFMGSYETIRLPENFNKEDLIIVLNESYYSMDDSSVCDNTNTNITDISK